MTLCPVAAGVAVAALLAQQSTQYVGKVEDLPIEVAPQPIALSHRQHAAVGMECLDCHSEATEKDWAGIPNGADCLACRATVATDHPEVRKLANFQSRKERIPWVRVYQVPAIVFFSHANHLKAGEECARCHGPVEKREVLMQEVSTSMIACMDCHTERKASNDCMLCHQLGH